MKTEKILNFKFTLSFEHVKASLREYQIKTLTHKINEAKSYREAARVILDIVENVNKSAAWINTPITLQDWSECIAEFPTLFFSHDEISEIATANKIPDAVVKVSVDNGILINVDDLLKSYFGSNQSFTFDFS